MKKLAVATVAALSFAMPAHANQPFRYESKCYLEVGDKYIDDVCVVIETRESGGGLKSRNIFSNKFGLTIKSWFDAKGFHTWDSFNKFQYDWQYKVGNAGGTTATYVMPGILLENVSWD